MASVPHVIKSLGSWVISDVHVLDHSKRQEGFLDTTGGTLWPAALRCVEYLATMSPELGLEKPGCNILELGSGLGYLGICLARNLPDAGCVCLTEQATGLQWLQANVEHNSSLPNVGSITTCECDWRDFESPAQPEQDASSAADSNCGQQLSSLDDKQAALTWLCSKRWDFIVGSDLIYNELGARLLPRVIKALSTRHTVCYYAHTKHRFDALDLEFLAECEAQGLEVEEVFESGAVRPPPSPPPLTELFPAMRIAMFRITARS